MTFTFPNKPLRTSVIRTVRNDELIKRVIRLKELGVNDSFRVAA